MNGELMHHFYISLTDPEHLKEFRFIQMCSNLMYNRRNVVFHKINNSYVYDTSYQAEHFFLITNETLNNLQERFFNDGYKLFIKQRVISNKEELCEVLNSFEGNRGLICNDFFVIYPEDKGFIIVPIYQMTSFIDSNDKNKASDIFLKHDMIPFDEGGKRVLQGIGLHGEKRVKDE